MASYHKGIRFMQECKRQGCNVLLLTVEKHLHSDWPREILDEVFALPQETLNENKPEVLNAVSFLARTRQIDRVVPLDDYDVEVAAMLREHLRIPGMGDTTVRYFRDKLAMREKARDSGILVPRFVHILNHAAVAEFMREVPGPWVFKPRSEAGSLGIKRIHRAEDLWPIIEELGDRQSQYLLEQMIPGDVYHVDSIVFDRKVLLAEVHRYRRPILQITQEGGIFGTHTLPRGGPEELELRPIHDHLLDTLGLVRGVAHTEFIKGREDGKIYFLETAARAGGAHITDLVEASTGLNLWEEWAKIEISQGKWPYELPKHERLYGGLVNSLAHQEHPDTGAYNDPEVWLRIDKSHHAGFILRAPTYERLVELMDSYEPRMERDFMAVLPPPLKAID
ncbi:MAG: ATPase [Myxococcales bacterium]|nr:MAG: ATPase [Myxococcales bacterium]